VRRGNSAKKTDYGTVILHWLLVGSLAVAMATGFRIAGEAPDRGWINVFDLILPKAAVWTQHLQAGVLLIAVSVAYGVYVRRVRLGARLRLDRVRLSGLLGRPYARWGTINILLYWLFFALMLSELVTGTLLYLGHAGSFLVQTHWIGMWLILGYGVIHILSQWRYGGAAQLLRVLRPTLRVAAPPQFELADILALLDKQSPQPAVPRAGMPVRVTANPSDRDRQFAVASGEESFQTATFVQDRVARIPLAKNEDRDNADTRSGHSVTQLNAFIVAGVVATLVVMVMLTSERRTVDTLRIHRIGATQVPTIDGETSDPIWRTTAPVYVRTVSGGNFQGTGETTISIQAVHDGVRAYFLFMWDDATRSLKQLPLRKSNGAWELLHNGYEIGDEHAYNEDKFSVLLTSLDTILAGDVTFHAGAAPLTDEPATPSGRGLHYTKHEGTFADVWEWKATSTDASKHCDDDYFGPPAKATQAQSAGLAVYRGGFAADPGTADYQDNFTLFPAGDGSDGVVPRRLPKDFNVLNASLGRIDLDPDHSESEAARWYLTEDESVPYSPERDRLIPDGAIVPGVLISGEYSGDRADVKCAGRWASGRWALEVERRLDVESRYDVPIRSGISMRVAAFDHSQTRHTRHVRALRLEVE
jgi:Ethylbenzene dehydrogenase/Prokaryotic cytochrome b561